MLSLSPNPGQTETAREIAGSLVLPQSSYSMVRSVILSIVYHLCRETLIENSPQNIFADTIEGLFEIYKVDVQVELPHGTLFYNNLHCCYLIHTASTRSEAYLLLSQLFIQRNLDALQDHSAKHLTYHVHATLVFTVAQITFLGQLD